MIKWYWLQKFSVEWKTEPENGEGFKEKVDPALGFEE